MAATAALGRPLPMVLDVRPAAQFSLMHLPHATHIPFEELEARLNEVKDLLQGGGTPAAPGTAESCAGELRNGRQESSSTLYVMCRRGNNSQLAVARLRELGVLNAVDVVGGIENWAKSVDDSMPVI